MKTNNKYYKLIAQLLDENINNKQHTDLYYSKRIAESYGKSYDDFGSVNKYLRDFAVELGVELDNKPHTRLYYLKRIADKLYDGELEHNTENYYLRIISENIEPTPSEPVQYFTVKATMNGNPITDGFIRDTVTGQYHMLDSDGEIKNCPFTLDSNHTGRYLMSRILNANPKVAQYYTELLFKAVNEPYDKAEQFRVKSTDAYIDVPTQPFTIHYKITQNGLGNEAIEVIIESV